MTSAHSTNSTKGGVRWEPPSPQHLQATLHGYEVLEVIGRGGMGAVYKARQLSLDRMVAIKILPPALWDDEDDYAERFRNEARVMARLMHPGMVAVFDFGETGDGQLYFVMEYVEGTDVARMIAGQQRLPPMNALAITAHVCDTLRYAHEHGVIHRDIKPANIMVDMEGRVKVADFGLARLTTLDDAHTHSTVTMGTPDFVAPETLTLGAVVDHRADLYSLGVMLYEMLTGQVPRGIFALPADCVEGLDRRFDAIVTRAMQADPDARYASAAEFRRDLDHIVTVPVLKAPASQRLPVQPAPSKSTGPPWGLIAGGIGALVVAGAFFAFLPNKKPRPPSPPEPVQTIAAASPSSSQPVAAAPKPQPKPPVRPPKPAQPKPSSSVAATPSLPAAPAPPPPPETDVARKLRELETQFRAALARDVTTVHDHAVTDLDTHYAAALERDLATATTAGKLDEAVALRQDKQRLEADDPLPDSEAPEAPESLKFLRQTYRSALAKLNTDQTLGVKSLRDKYEQVVTAYQVELTKAGNLDGAQEVSLKLKAWRSGSLAAGPQAKVEVDGTTMEPLRMGEKVYGNVSSIVWATIPDALQGCLFSRAKEQKKATVRIKVLTDGVVQMACTSRWDRSGKGEDWKKGLISERQLEAEGWQYMEMPAELKATKESHAWRLYARQCKAGESFTYRTEKYLRPILVTRDPTAPSPDLASFAAFLPGTIWLWDGEKGENMEFLKDGTVAQATWTRTGLKTGWEVVGPHEVKLTILSGRKNNMTASLIFAEDRTSFTGKNFNPKDKLRKSPWVTEAATAAPAPAVTPAINGTQAEALFNTDAPLVGNIQLPVRCYYPKNPIVVGQADAKAIVASVPGTIIQAGGITVHKGAEWDAYGTLFNISDLAIDFGAKFTARGSLFDKCRLRKSRSPFIRFFSTKWVFENCVFNRSFFQSWQLNDVGTQIHACTFHGVNFARRRYVEDAGKEALEPWVAIKACRFVNCTIPESLLIATQNCVFENCVFGKAEDDIPIVTPIKVRLYLAKCKDVPTFGSNRTLEVLDGEHLAPQAGATVTYRWAGSALSF